MKQMKIEKQGDGWWIIDPNNQDCGPYETKADATDDKQGLTRFYRNYDGKTPDEVYKYEQQRPDED